MSKGLKLGSWKLEVVAADFSQCFLRNLVAAGFILRIIRNLKVAATICLLLATCCLFSATPSKIKYQGVLKEKGVLVNGAKTMKFRITNSDGATAYWDSGNVSVTATQGAFSYELAVSTDIDWKSGGYYL